jgi:calcineurin-like phosphoesterase family protein
MSRNEVWFTADTHFNHANIIRYCNRPFQSIEEHDEALIENWNNTVHHSDTIYHLGDFMFAKSQKEVSRVVMALNGHKHLIFGNHDKTPVFQSKGWVSQQNYKYIRHQHQRIVMCHYAMRVWRNSHHGAWMLYGHSHGTLADLQIKSLDVGTDCHNYTPIHFDQLKAILDIRPTHQIDHHRT